MQVNDYVHLVGSGNDGFSLSDRCDCHVWLLDAGDASVIVDCGGGRDTERILELIDGSGRDRGSIEAILVTHAHADHGGGASGLADALGAPVMASAPVADILRRGDASAASVPVGQASGAYPDDYAYRSCPVERELEDGERLRIGNLEIEVVATPGHATGHLCYLVHTHGHRDLFSGDMLLFGGRIILQNTWDCDLAAYLGSVRRLQTLGITGLFPGHLSFSLKGAYRHVDLAAAALDLGKIPPTL